MIEAATTREQHARGHINRRLYQLDRELRSVRADVAAGSMSYDEAGVWCRLLVESTWDAITDLLAFASRGTS
ncbi:MAG: hypothetical protein EPO65_00435 [Dehalococcoidia bacterium]|nr:MAG: hypothetical protein EPO65_00435 [Dehalococcoidia bacterium]